MSTLAGNEYIFESACSSNCTFHNGHASRTYALVTAGRVTLRFRCVWVVSGGTFCLFARSKCDESTIPALILFMICGWWSVWQTSLSLVFFFKRGRVREPHFDVLPYRHDRAHVRNKLNRSILRMLAVVTILSRCRADLCMSLDFDTSALSPRQQQ